MSDELEQKADKLMAMLGYLERDEITAHGKYDGTVSARRGQEASATIATFGDRQYADFFVGARLLIPLLVAEVRRLRERLLKCHWVKYNRSDFCLWETTCGHSFQIDNDYSPSENGMRFCSYCGKELIEETESQ